MHNEKVIVRGQRSLLVCALPLACCVSATAQAAPVIRPVAGYADNIGVHVISDPNAGIPGDRPFDAGNDDAYGTDGYVLFATAELTTPIGNGGFDAGTGQGTTAAGTGPFNTVMNVSPSRGTRFVLPPYITSVATPGAARIAVGGWGYSVIKGPAAQGDTALVDREAGISGINAAAGRSQLVELFRINISAGMPANGFRLGVWFASASSESGERLRITGTDGADSGNVTIVTKGTVENDIYFFDITNAVNGDILSLWTGNNNSTTYKTFISGLTFDTRSSVARTPAYTNTFMWKRTDGGFLAFTGGSNQGNPTLDANIGAVWRYERFNAAGLGGKGSGNPWYLAAGIATPGTLLLWDHDYFGSEGSWVKAEGNQDGCARRNYLIDDTSGGGTEVPVVRWSNPTGVPVKVNITGTVSYGPEGNSGGVDSADYAIVKRSGATLTELYSGTFTRGGASANIDIRNVVLETSDQLLLSMRRVGGNTHVSVTDNITITLIVPDGTVFIVR